METNGRNEAADKQGGNEKEFQSLDEIVEQWVYGTIREDWKEKRLVDPAA